MLTGLVLVCEQLSLRDSSTMLFIIQNFNCMYTHVYYIDEFNWIYSLPANFITETENSNTYNNIVINVNISTKVCHPLHPRRIYILLTAVRHIWNILELLTWRNISQLNKHFHLRWTMTWLPLWNSLMCHHISDQYICGINPPSGPIPPMKHNGITGLQHFFFLCHSEI